MATYAVLSVSILITAGLTAFLVCVLFVNLSFTLHNSILKKVTYAEMPFFSLNPLGPIINRFSKDTAVADNTVSF